MRDKKKQRIKNMARKFLAIDVLPILAIISHVCLRVDENAQRLELFNLVPGRHDLCCFLRLNIIYTNQDKQLNSIREDAIFFYKKAHLGSI